MSSSEPPCRYNSFSAAANSCFYVWGGNGVPEDDLQYLYVFDSATESWDRQFLNGRCPPGVHSGASASVEQCLYLYGGLSRTGDLTGSLFELSTTTLSWREVSPPVATGPKKKKDCGMVNYGAALIIFGGQTAPGQHRTSELHVYDTVTGNWSSPHFTGQHPCDCSSFTFTKVSHHQVVLHGGVKNSDTYILDLSTMHWTKFPSYVSGTPGLFGHSAVCLGFDSDYSQLLVFGGLFMKSIWLLDVATRTWMKLQLGIDSKHVNRLQHSAAVVKSTPNSEEVVISGGYRDSHVPNTTVLRFRKQPSTPQDVSSVQWWYLADLIISGKQLGKKEWLQYKWNLGSQGPNSGVAIPFVSSKAMSTVEKSDTGTESTEDKVHNDVSLLSYEGPNNEDSQCTDASLNILVEHSMDNAVVEDDIIFTGNRERTSHKTIITHSDAETERTKENVCSDVTSLSDEGLNKEGWESTDTSLNSHQPLSTESKHAEPQAFIGDVMKAVAEKQQIRRKMANIILQGLPGSGKTSLLDRLLNRPIRSYYCSTGVSEDIVIVDISPTSTLSAAHAYDDSTWKVIDFDKSLVAQLDYCKEFIPGQVKESSQAVGSNHQELETDIEDLSKIHLSSNIEDHVKTVLKEYDIKNIEDLQTINSLYIRDTGGQVEFQESLSLLIFGPSIFIFVIKTNVDINTKHIIQYRSPTGEIINRYESSISTVDALLQFLTSVSAIQTTEDGVFQKEDGAYLTHKPIVFIVGTHIDQLGSEATSVIDKMNSDLDKLIHGNSFSDLVYYADGRLNKVMYLVNNTSDEDHNFQVLRSSINRFISTRNEFTIEYPVSYLLFCLELQSIKETVITMDDCIELAAMFGIKKSDIKYLLHFLQFRVGIIQYYDVEGLSDLIIKEPQVLFNKVTDLVVMTFLSSGSLNMSQQDSFCKKGILEACAFDNILSGEDKITSKQFLCFLLHLRMAVPFTDKKGILKYFIPSVLNHVPKPLCSENKTDVAPLAITFESGHCPKGLLSMMVSHLMNPEKSQEVTFDLLEDNIYQDQVSLLAHSTEDMDEVCIKRYLSHLEIRIFFEKSCTDEESQTLLAPRANTPTKVCSNICTILQDCLEQSLKMLHYDYKKVGPMFCVACPQENCEQFHEVKKGKGFRYMHCTTDKVKLRLPKSGGHWFKEGAREASLSSTKKNSKTLTEATLYTTGPNLDGKSSTSFAAEVASNQSVPDFSIKNLTLLKWVDINGHTQSIRIRDELSAKWQEVGDLLGLKASYLETLDTQYRGDARIICRRILLDWIQKDNERSYPVSWDGLLCLLEDMQLTALAKELKTALKHH